MACRHLVAFFGNLASTNIHDEYPLWVFAALGP